MVTRVARHVRCAIIGAGQSGLACAYYLRKYGVEHVLIDASTQPGGSWPRYWDSLTLFSRAEFSNLPGWPMPAFDGYPPRDHVVDYLTRYEARYGFEVLRGRPVERLLYDDSRFLLHPLNLTSDTVVVATGIASAPFVPFVPGEFAGEQLHSVHYVNPAQFAGRRVAVVGAGNSGAQVAADLALAGVEVDWFTRGEPAYMPDDVDGSELFRRNRERFLAIAKGEPDPGGANFGGDVVAVPPVRRARDAGLIPARQMFTSLDELNEVGADAIIWATGFRPALSVARGVDPATPGLFFLGFDSLSPPGGGPGAGTVGGVAPFAREVARQVASSG